MDSLMQEKRRFPRKPLAQPAEVVDKDTGLVIGILANISRGGFSLVTDRGIRPSEIRHVTLALPGPHERQHRLSLTAECVWCQSLNEERDYAAGFSLCTLTEQDGVALDYFIRDYQVSG